MIGPNYDVSTKYTGWEEVIVQNTGRLKVKKKTTLRTKGHIIFESYKNPYLNNFM